MEKLNNSSEFSLTFKYALKDLSRNYRKLSSENDEVALWKSTMSRS